MARINIDVHARVAHPSAASEATPLVVPGDERDDDDGGGGGGDGRVRP